MDFKKLKVSNCKIKKSDFDLFYTSPQKEDKTLELYPIIVENKKNIFSVLYGFQKLESLQKENKKFVPAYIIKSADFLEKVKLVIKYHRQKRELYPIEIARIIKMLEYNGVEKSIIATEIADAMHINRGYQITDEYRELIEVPEYIANYLVDKNVALKIYKKYIHRDELIFKKLVEQERPTLSEFLEITELLTDLANREGQDIFEIVNEYELMEILEKNDNQNIEKIRNILKEKRYPIKSKYQQIIKEELKKMNPPNFIHINPDRTLETRSVTFEAKISTEENLEVLKDFIENNNFDPIKNIINLELDNDIS